MRVSSKFVLLSALLVGTGLVVACGGPAEKGAGNPEELAALQQQQQELQALRQELRELRMEQEAAPPGTEEEAAETGTEEEPAEEGMAPTGEQAMTPEERAKHITELEQKISDLSDEYGGRLVTYINSLGIVQGEPLTPEQKTAIRMKSEEDLQIAREWIDRGGDYRRAIEIYQAQIALDPDYQPLQDALKEAQEMRFPTEERFAQVKKGMTQDQVREILGQVNIRNVRDYPDKNVVAWFYRKEDGGAAGVYFRPDHKSGEMIVYQATFEAVKQEGEEGGEEG